MKKGALNDFSLRTNDFSSLAGLPDLAFVNEHFGMFLNIGPYRDRFVRPGQPYRFVEGRIMWITGGSADLDAHAGGVSRQQGRHHAAGPRVHRGTEVVQRRLHHDGHNI